MAEVKDRRAGKSKARSAAAAKNAAVVKSEDPVPASAEASAAPQPAAAAAEAAPQAPAPAARAAAPAASAVERETVRTREVKAMEQNGAGVLAVMFALEDVMEDDKRLQRAVHAAKLFLIAVIFIAPVLLMWQHAF